MNERVNIWTFGDLASPNAEPRIPLYHAWNSIIECLRQSLWPPPFRRFDFDPLKVQPCTRPENSLRIMNSLRSLKPLYYTGTGGAVRSPTVASIKTHTMGSSLSEYLRMKVHPDIQNHRWSRIIVKGEHQRDPSKVSISTIEKKDKPFNWQRPSASFPSSETVQLHCFPGTDYVQHYAAITATYLSLQ